MTQIAEDGKGQSLSAHGHAQDVPPKRTELPDAAISHADNTQANDSAASENATPQSPQIVSVAASSHADGTQVNDFATSGNAAPQSPYTQRASDAATREHEDSLHGPAIQAGSTDSVSTMPAPSMIGAESPSQLGREKTPVIVAPDLGGSRQSTPRGPAGLHQPIPPSLTDSVKAAGPTAPGCDQSGRKLPKYYTDTESESDKNTSGRSQPAPFSNITDKDDPRPASAHTNTPALQPVSHEDRVPTPSSTQDHDDAFHLPSADNTSSGVSVAYAVRKYILKAWKVFTYVESRPWQCLGRFLVCAMHVTFAFLVTFDRLDPKFKRVFEGVLLALVASLLLRAVGILCNHLVQRTHLHWPAHMAHDELAELTEEVFNLAVSLLAVLLTVVGMVAGEKRWVVLSCVWYVCAGHCALLLVTICQWCFAEPTQKPSDYLQRIGRH